MTFLHNVRVQANLWCTSSRARKVVISLTLDALTIEVINMACYHLAHTLFVNSINTVLFQLLMPVTVLVINVVVAIQVRRAAIHSAANLGVQPHHQSTAAVPTIMLITTSLIYVLFQTMRGSFYVLLWLMRVFRNNFSIKTRIVVDNCLKVASAVYQLIYAYNFYVYLITGKQFRSDLRKLLCRCLSFSSSAPAHALDAPAVIAAAAAADDDDDAEVAIPVTAETTVRNLVQYCQKFILHTFPVTFA